ncbi:4Fe-4S dicluster domain-containing protein [Desulfovibrio piger]|uniref:4Fe-4S dicluster domain-containing protein n=1 Tax=Desulfovibrio piger TaxID=901 RepID=UPI0026F13458|nr:ferredoxin family protein [Desulfovibrio piger]
MPPYIDPQKCVGCGICKSICPMQIFYQKEVKQVPEIIYGEECWHCNACVLDCKTCAITLRIPINYMLLHTDVSTLHR